jgi:hypothetical protein
VRAWARTGHQEERKKGICYEPEYDSFLKVLGCLPSDEYREFWRLSDCKHRSEQDDERMLQLIQEALQRYDDKQTAIETEETAIGTTDTCSR